MYMLGRLKAWLNSACVARKHVANWSSLVFKYLSDSRGLFQARAGGALSCDARALLKQLVRLENAWRHYGDTLPTVRFEHDSLIIPSYFGRDFAIPLKAEGIAPPSALVKMYPFDVKGDTVLDIGAYLGDTPLMWLYKGAARVIAVEPVPLHFHYLEKNTASLPVVCLKAALAVRLPHIQGEVGSVKYGLWDWNGDGTNVLNSPVVQLLELVEVYKPTVVKLDCEGCEHHVLEQIMCLPELGVRTVAVEFHEVKGFDPYTSLSQLEERLEEGVKTEERTTVSNDGRRRRIVTAYWML
jgi:FkbM family methyltransferase